MRKVKGSRNREKAQMRLARLHRRIANIRRDWTHKLTANLKRRYGVIVLEDLAVRVQPGAVSGPSRGCLRESEGHRLSQIARR